MGTDAKIDRGSGRQDGAMKNAFEVGHNGFSVNYRVDDAASVGLLVGGSLGSKGALSLAGTKILKVAGMKPTVMKP
jgi:hypothetical protein